MSLSLVDGRPAIFCGKCAQKLTVGETQVLTYGDIAAVMLVCQPCADELVKRWKEKCADTMPATRYFQLLIGRATRQ